MAEEKKQMAIVEFLSLYFKNFHKILLANLLFAVPCVLFAVPLYYANSFFNGVNIAIVSAIIIFAFPFYAGVTMVTRNIMNRKAKVNVVKDFIKGVKENWLVFLLHGAVLYLVFLISFFSWAFYSSLTQETSVAYAFLILCGLIVLFAVFASFYLPVMTVTYKLSIKNIYKNSALMTFGELKHNLFALLGLILFGGVFTAFLFLASNTTMFYIIFFTLLLAVTPATVSSVINFCVYGGMADMIGNKEQKIKDVEQKINQNSTEKKEVNIQDFSDITIDKKADKDEYIFHNGKMIKRSVLLREMDQAEQFDQTGDEKSRKE